MSYSFHFIAEVQNIRLTAYQNSLEVRGERIVRVQFLYRLACRLVITPVLQCRFITTLLTGDESLTSSNTSFALSLSSWDASLRVL